MDPAGRARMVSVRHKRPTARFARAEAWVDVGPAVASRLRESGGVAKGDVLETARIAGILAAKRVAELIPMCHPLTLESVEIDADLVADRVRIESRVQGEAKTGFEMEAMTAASVAALTVYDMVKSMGLGVAIGPIRLLEKSGGKTGRWRARGGHRGAR